MANGVVHWYSLSRTIAVYDPEGGDQRIQLITLPHSCCDDREKGYNYAITRSVDDDVLWLAVLHKHKRTLMFYMLPKEGGYKRQVKICRKEWVLMDDVSVSSILSISKLMKCKGGFIACENYVHLRVIDTGIGGRGCSATTGECVPLQCAEAKHGQARLLGPLQP